jgi:hypothetical protein
MDNGLIFPYPLARAHVEPGDANHPNLWLVLRDWFTGERGTRTGSRQAIVVTQEGSPSQAMVVLGQGCRAVRRQIRAPYA